MSDDDEYARHRDALNMSIVGTKGLLNPSGENNCFLNSAVQVFDENTLTDWLCINFFSAVGTFQFPHFIE